MLDMLPAGRFSIVMQIELRLSQTHGTYFMASPTQAEELSPLFDENQLGFGCSLHGELRIVPPEMEVFTFGDQARGQVARALRDAGHSVSLAEPDPLVYVGPVAGILDLREQWNWNLPPEEWELPVPGLLAEHSGDLLRMATDQDLSRGKARTGCLNARWHAWRALALLQIEEALEPLAEHIDAIDWSLGADDEEVGEWALEELASLFAAFGPIAVPTLAKRLLDPGRREEVRTGTVECLKRIGEHPRHDPATVCPLLHRALEAFETNPPALNAFLISALTDFKAQDSLPLIEAAFAADRVDEMWRGDWEDIQMEFGLIQRRTRPRRPNKLTEMRDALMKAMDASRSRAASQDVWDHALPAKPAKVGRNDPCPCGSGKKHKKCCG